MNYQGRLTDNTPGQAPIDVPIAITFRIYDAMIGGVLEWEEPWGGVPVTGGIFNVMLGSNGVPIPAGVFGGATRYLEIEVNGELLTPRQRLGSVGFAQQSENSADVDCVDCIEPGEIATGAVGEAELASGSVGTAELQANSVEASEIAAGAVGSSEIAANAVGNAEIDNTQVFNFRSITLETAGAEFISRNGGVDKLELWAEANSSYFYHRPASSYLAVNDSTGHWGIGTTSPIERWTVIGNVRANSFIDGNNPAFYINPAGASVVSSISGSGSGLTNLNASNISSGTLADARLSGNVARTNLANVFLQTQEIEGPSFRYLIVDATTNGSGAAGIILREANSNRWYFRSDNATDRLNLYGFGVGGNVLTVDYSTGNTNIRNLQMTATAPLDVATATTSNTSPTCPAGTVRTGGGCRCGAGSLEKNYPSGSSAWYCECSVSTNVDAHVICLESTDP
jgi:hypothetical protein